MDKRYWIWYVSTDNLINDICGKCDTIINCGYHEHLQKLDKRKKEKRE